MNLIKFDESTIELIKHSPTRWYNPNLIQINKEPVHKHSVKIIFAFLFYSLGECKVVIVLINIIEKCCDGRRLIMDNDPINTRVVKQENP